MRYEETSGTLSSAAGTPDARDDADLLPSGSHAPATGNVISGAGTTTGEAGADTPASGQVIALRGAGGTDTSDSGANLNVAGRYGTLSMDEHGNYKYVPEPRAPQGVRDVFTYTLESKDGRDTAELVINLGDRIQVSENAQRIVPGPDGVVNLPPGVSLSDVHVVGRDLVVTLPDGSQIIIVDGAVFVPQLVIDGVGVPSTNLASLLIESEPIVRPVGGPPQSSGGNFDVPVPPLDPGTPLGDLIPPTELIFGNPRFEEIGQFINREPEAGVASAQLDDDAQQGGNPGGIGDVEPTLSSFSGSLPGDGGDGSLEWALLASGTLPSGFSFALQGNGDMWILQGGVHVLTIAVNEDTGAYTVTQIAAIDHPAGGDENDLSFVINYSVTDDDGDVAIGSLTVNVDDDTPVVTVTAGSDSAVLLTTHDALTIGAGQEAVSTTANFSGVFGATSVSPGADGAGSGTTSGYALSTTGGASGLLSHGVVINLYNVGGVIVGSTATSAAGITTANTIFTVSTTNTGIVTLTQFQQIDHTNADPTPGGAIFDDHGISLADGAITLTRTETVVDGDGDSVTGSAAVQIGANLRFLDDGPTIGIADRGEPSLTVDETVLATNATASFAANFGASFGADGPAANAITYALGITGGNGVNSGLIDVATGQAIVLVLNGGVVEGHVGNAAGALAFTVSVNAAGEVTLDQIRALTHPNPANPDDSVTLSADNLVTLTATAHDFDGDTATATLNIGQNLNFEDDGPSISLSGSEPSLTVDETVLATNASASVAAAFTSAFGADGAGTVTYALGITGGNGTASGLIDVATGLSIVLVNNAGVIEGHVGNAAGALAFTVTIDASGNVALDQIRALTHPNAANPDDSVTLSADNLITITGTVTDRDGDTASAVLNFGQNLNFEDDGPSISLSGSEPSLTVDETVLATNATASFAGAFTSAFGADGAGTVGYALSITGGNGTASGLVDVATGQAIVLVNNAGVIEGHVGNAAGALAFTVSVNAAGDVTLDQIRAVQHPNPANPDDSVTLGADNLVVLTATVTDRDGDQASVGLNIGQNLNFEDDGPSINASGEQPSLTVDETVLATNASTSFAGVFISSFGADGAGSISYALGITGGNGVASGLVDVATGQPIVLVNNAGVIEGHVGNAAGAVAFTVSIDANTGVVTLDQVRALTHPNAANPDDSVTLSADNLVTITATITDRDGDQQAATANIGQNLNFEDDGPSISTTGVEPQLTVDETVLATNATQSFAANFNSAFGADGAGTVSYALSITGGNGTASGLIDVATGQPIVLVNNAGVIEGHVGNAAGALAFTVSVNASGSVTLDQIRALQHPNPANPDDSVTLSADNLIVLTGTVTDRDGDSQSASLNIGQNLNFEDDGPSAINDSDTITSGGSTAQGNVITGIGTDAGAASADSAGADGGGHITAVQGTGAPDTTFTAGLLEVNGAHGTLTIDAAGNYTYTRNAGSPGNVDDVFTYTFTDADGDSVTATLTIHINDAAPNPPANVTVLLDDDALLNGNAGGTGDRSPDTQNTTGTLVATGGDGDLDYFISASQSLPTGFTSNLTALAGVQTLQIFQNGTLVITVTLTNETGAYTVTQNAPIVHALDGNTEGEIPVGNLLSAINVSVFAQDFDGDPSPPGTISISVDDDTPVINANGTQPNLTVDETVLATNATASFAGVFNNSFGADGPALAGSVTYALAITGGNGTASGLVDVATGLSIVLVNNAGVIEGHVGNAAGALAFTVSVNAAGDVTLDQIRAVTHPNTANPDDSVTLANDNLITLSSTITDRDGDTATATANIGQNLNFEDDGPSISTTGVEPQLTVDETVLATNASASFAANFTSAFGADGAGTVTYALSITGGNGTASGLIDVATGQSIVLVNNAGVIEGHVGNAAGALAFTVSVDASGNVTLDQVRALTHPNAANPDDSVTLSADNLVVLTGTVTDRDGDSQSASLNIGQNLNFEDDGPSIGAGGTQPNLTVDETVLATNASASFAGVFTPTFGADGAAAANSLTYALAITGGNGTASGLIDVATGLSIVLVNNAGVIEGHVGNAAGALAFTVSVDASGNVTLDQIRALTHPNTANPDDSVTLANDNLITLTATATDRDGDQASATANIGQNLNFEDDGPSISTTGVEPQLTVDETVLATNASASFAANFNSSFGADGAGTLTYALSITGGNGTASGLIDVATGSAIVLVNNAGVIEGHVGNAAGALAFTVTVDASGNVALDQIRALTHPNTANPDDSVTLSADNLVVLTATVTDRDGDSQSASLNIGQNLNFEDDGPAAVIVETGQGVSVDESVGVQSGDSNDTTNAGIIALFAGVGNPGTDTDLPQYATNASAVVASTGSGYGADGAGTTVFSLNVSSAGVDSGLNTTAGSDIFLFKEGNLVVGRVGNGSGPAAFAIAIDPVTGQISMVEYLSIQHPNAANPDDSVSIADGALQAVVTVTDRDGDSATSTPTNIGNLISFQDSGPVMTAAQNINIQNSGDVAHTGQFAFNLGADGANASNDVITNVVGTVTVNGNPVQNWTLTPGVEDANTASYSFSFDYSTGSGTAHETGTLVFNKATGQYTVDLANPIAGISIVSTSDPSTTFVESSPEVTTAQLGTNLFVQFTGMAEPGSGTGADNLRTIDYDPNPAAPNPTFEAPPGAWENNELFNQATTTVQVSSVAAGVAGNTIHAGEVLDFNLYNSAPGATPGNFPTSSAGTMFLKFDTIGTAEDFFVVLKLWSDTNGNGTIDATGDTFTTRILVVQNSDIQKGPGTGPGIFSGITLDNNDGLIIIESNDYNAAGETYQIVGAQIVNTAEGVTGTGINFVNTIGAGGASNVANTGTYQNLSTVDDSANFKIQSIGFVTTNTTNQNAHMQFDVTVTDGDGDSITQTIVADVTQNADSASAATIPAGNTTISAAPLNTKSTATVSDSYQPSQQTTTNSNPVLTGALAAAGLAAEPLAAHSVQSDLNSSVSTFATAAYHTQALAPIALDGAGNLGLSDLMSSHLDVRGVLEAQSSILRAPAFGDGPRLDSGHDVVSPLPAQFLQGTQAPAHDGGPLSAIMPASVAMPSAQQLAGLAAGGVAGGQHNQVVGQVLADALNGGGTHGATLDALINALPGHGGGASDTLAALASQNGAPVSFGDIGGFAGFSATHIGLSMEHAAMVHQDATPLHA